MKIIDQKAIAECYQPLFDLMHEEHNLTLTVSEMDDIISKSMKVNENFNNIVRDLITTKFDDPNPIEYKKYTNEGDVKKFTISEEF